jgi:hypothetical protein
MGLLDTQALGHLFVQETLTGAVRLNPLAINNELGDGAFSRVPNHLFSCSGGDFDVDFFVRNIVLLEEAPGHAAVRAPEGRVQDEFHWHRLDTERAYRMRILGTIK